MKNHGGIPWFVFNNRTREEQTIDPMRERRACVITICYAVTLGLLSALAASYCWTAFLIILILNAIVGFFSIMRTVFRFCRGDKRI